MRLGLVWKIFKISRINNSENTCVVMGFPRSGTSLVASLISECGYSFGEEKDMKEGRKTNPMGFYENLRFFKLMDECLRQSGYKRSYAPQGSLSLSAKGIVNKAKRLITRKKIRNLLHREIQRNGKFAVKSTPLNFYFFRQYIPKCKIVAVYRDPIVTSHSNTKIFSRGYTFSQLLRYWGRSYEETLYHISTCESLLIRYEDLFDEKKRDVILQELAAFLGGGNINGMRDRISPELVRSKKEVEVLKENYPLDRITKEIFQTLESLKISERG